MDLNQLRTNLQEPIVSLYRHTEKEFPAICEQLGLPAPRAGETKQKIMRATFEAAMDVDLPTIAMRFLKCYPPDASVRNRIEDLLWATTTIPPISKKARREIAEGLTIEDLYEDADEFEKLMESIWILDDDPFAFAIGESRLLKDIRQHVLRNSDWTVNELFKSLGALDSPTQRFVRFLEGLASPEVQPNSAHQNRFAEKVNVSLRKCGIELRETGERDGYPLFTACSMRAVRADTPKYLIFASREKPDIRIPDTISNNIEIVTNAEKVLVYDHPISSDGLRWCDLQAWWAEDQAIVDGEAAKNSLYNRLKQALPPASESPPQRNFYYAYHKAFRAAIPMLPALLPEVWLHWDPKTIQQRGKDALTRFRMDFLMLLPNGSRVVFEIDGKHHYTDGNGKPNPSKYAEMMAADRELKLAGYEVYRFGATELTDEKADEIVSDFFEKLFRAYKIGIPATLNILK